MSDSLIPPAGGRSRVLWRGLGGAGAALHLARAAAQLPHPLLVIAPDATTVARLEQELRFFAPAGFFDPDVSRLRDAALRPVLAAPGHHLAAAANPRASARPRQRAGGHRSRDLPAAPATTQLRGRARAHARHRPGAGPGAVPAAPDCRRLRQRPAGRGTRRIRDPRLVVRRVPDGQRRAAAHRPVRPADRQHPQLRPRHAALERAAGNASNSCRRASSASRRTRSATSVAASVPASKAT